MEQTMEVVSYSDAIEICETQGFRFIKVYPGRGVNSGKLIMRYDDMGNGFLFNSDSRWV